MKQLAYPYYRVSTMRQGRSGLGLAAQRKAVEDYARAHGFRLGKAYVEIESGRKNKRPILSRALQSCKANRATLLIAKLDRLSRNVVFVSSLMESGIEFKAVDNPNANKLVLHILAAFAEHERDEISKRTKDALQAAKSRGTALGNFGRTVLAERNRKAAQGFALKMRLSLYRLRKEGFTTVRAIAAELNTRNVPTYQKNARWHPATVSKILRAINRQAEAKPCPMPQQAAP
jgi:DNA invertase Pin-like site-specific DNA recombinase